MEDFHRVGSILNQRYRITGQLGQGATGITYGGEDLQTESRRKVAIKTLSLRQVGEWKMLELFEREAKVLAHISHPRIPKYIDYLTVDTPQDRRFYLVQEQIDGDSLATLVRDGWRTDEATVKDIAAQVLEILIYLHGLVPPVIHRDIKPQNLIRNHEGAIYLVDFGAVQDLYRYGTGNSFTFVGTHGYIAPEQFHGAAQAASDLYSLGATLVYLLTHCPPGNLPQQRMKIDFRALCHPSAGFAQWLDRLLEPVIEDRFSDAMIALAALKAIDQPVSIPANRDLTLSAPDTPSQTADTAQTINQETTTGKITIPSGRIKPPLDTRVKCQITPEQIEVTVPALGWRCLTWVYGVMGVGCWWVLQNFVMPYFNVWGLLSQIPVGLAILVLGFITLTCGALWIYALVGKFVIKINRERFVLQSFLAGVPISKDQGYTSSITNIAQETLPDSSVHYGIWVGDKKYLFDSLLIERPDLEWILGELYYFWQEGEN
ncbi:MAG: serine/threonine protein kinase [Pseudanabaenaceae cyanobacterium]